MKNTIRITILLALYLAMFSCKDTQKSQDQVAINPLQDSNFNFTIYTHKLTDRKISHSDYADKLYGFWSAQCIANGTGPVTEMVEVGNIGETKTGDFYTREDSGTVDLPNIWSDDQPSELSKTIDFVFLGEDEILGTDDDTDVEYMYQHLLYTNKTSILTGEQIRNGWLEHMKHEEENYLWVANQRALELMLTSVFPPATSDSKITKDTIYDNYHKMIDAQLTTEIFGVFLQLI